jgi:bifunctional DNA-binding transcriptional regulator/antitoxin component of YhaV-PrlF toxin-antitoxin module
MSAIESKPMTAIATLDQDGRLVLPEEIRQLAALEAGDSFEVVIAADGILLRPCVDADDEDPAKFWGPNWRAEVEADLADIAAGRTTYHDSEEEFLASLS